MRGRKTTTALLLALFAAGCTQPERPPDPIVEPDPEPRYERTVATGGVASRLPDGGAHVPAVGDPGDATEVSVWW